MPDKSRQLKKNKFGQTPKKNERKKKHDLFERRVPGYFSFMRTRTFTIRYDQNLKVRKSYV